MKSLLHVRRNVSPHWVGDGFPVRSLFSYHEGADAIDPFLLLDYAGPAEFDPADQPRGVDEHPHRGFETVTIVYQGELEHRDSAGNRGRIGPGDVQWMTAASGVVHEEFHGREFTRQGGVFEVIQLWVNLPAEFKMTEPRYQEIPGRDIPRIELPDGAGSVRVIAGELQGTRGPAQTFTPINLWDVELRAEHSAVFPVPEGFTTALVVQRGAVSAGDGEQLRPVDLALLDRRGNEVSLSASEDARLMLLSGQPIGEPVEGHGPFVMNNREEIRQAVVDYQSGRMGSLD